MHDLKEREESPLIILINTLDPNFWTLGTFRTNDGSDSILRRYGAGIRTFRNHDKGLLIEMN